MDQPTLTDHVQLSRRAISALLDVRYRAESSEKVDANTYPRSVVGELIDAGVVTYVVGKLVLTPRGRTCGIRNSGVL